MKITLSYCLVLVFAVTFVSGSPAKAQETENHDEETTQTQQSRGQWLRERLWRQVYAQAIYSRHDNRNIIADGSIRQGIHWIKYRDRWVDLYLKARLLGDRNRDYWNNVGEMGIVPVRREMDYRGFS